MQTVNKKFMKANGPSIAFILRSLARVGEGSIWLPTLCHVAGEHVTSVSVNYRIIECRETV